MRYPFLPYPKDPPPPPLPPQPQPQPHRTVARLTEEQQQEIFGGVQVTDVARMAQNPKFAELMGRIFDRLGDLCAEVLEGFYFLALLSFFVCFCLF